MIDQLANVAGVLILIVVIIGVIILGTVLCWWIVSRWDMWMCERRELRAHTEYEVDKMRSNWELHQENLRLRRDLDAAQQTISRLSKTSRAPASDA